MFAALDRLQNKTYAEARESVAAKNLQRRAEPQIINLKTGDLIQLYRPEHLR